MKWKIQAIPLKKNVHIILVSAYHLKKNVPNWIHYFKLDTLFQNEKFDLIKIDVQGAEMNVLEGGKEMIKHTSFNGNAIFRSI